jgi:hypothetical protein
VGSGLSPLCRSSPSPSVSTAKRIPYVRWGMPRAALIRDGSLLRRRNAAARTGWRRRRTSWPRAASTTWPTSPSSTRRAAAPSGGPAGRLGFAGRRDGLGGGPAGRLGCWLTVHSAEVEARAVAARARCSILPEARGARCWAAPCHATANAG